MAIGTLEVAVNGRLPIKKKINVEQFPSDKEGKRSALTLAWQ